MVQRWLDLKVNSGSIFIPRRRCALRRIFLKARGWKGWNVFWLIPQYLWDPTGYRHGFCSLRFPIRTPKNVIQNCWPDQPIQGRTWIRDWIVEIFVSPAFNGLERFLSAVRCTFRRFRRDFQGFLKFHPQNGKTGVRLKRANRRT